MEAKSELRRASRRDKLFVVATILEIAQNGAQKTQIMYRANLSFSQVCDFIRFMVKIDLLKLRTENGREAYVSTEKGIDFLLRYREIASLLGVESYRSRYESRIPMLRTELGRLKDAVANIEIGLFDTSACPKCQGDVFRDYKFCPHCGIKLDTEIAQGQ